MPTSVYAVVLGSGIKVELLCSDTTHELGCQHE
jgi:hypothetical protein